MIFSGVNVFFLSSTQTVLPLLQVKDQYRLSKINRVHVNNTSVGRDITSICPYLTFSVINLR